jgi:DNA-binding transcriptional LysR family regulator
VLRTVRLTPVGQVLLDHARTVLSTLRTAEIDLAAVVSGDRGRLRVGTIQSVGTRVIPGLLTRFAADRPSVEIVLHEAHDPDDLLAMVESQDLDVTFICGRDPAHVEGPFTVRPVLEDPFVLLAPADDVWSGRTSITLEEIAAHPLIGNRNPTCSLQQRETFGELDPTFVFHSDDNSTVQGCVAAGLGVSLTPMLTIDLDDPTTTVVPVVPPVSPRIISVAWHANREPTPLVEAFLAATADICDAIAAEWSGQMAASLA